MSSSPPRCCWCGTDLPQAAGQAQALLCPSCAGAGPVAPPLPQPAAALPSRDRQAVLGLGVAIAAVLLLGAGSVLLALLPRGDAPPAPAAPVRQVAAAAVPAPAPDPDPPTAPAESPPPAPRPAPPPPQAVPRFGDFPAAPAPPPPAKPAAAPPRPAPTEAELRQQLAKTAEVPLCGRLAYALATAILAEQKDAPAEAVPARLRAALRAAAEGPPPKWLRPENVPGLVELLAEEDAADRRLLVKLLARVSGPKATEALARRATFDFDPGVRQAAVKELRGRPPEEYRPTFLKALRSPWPPPAKHAAKALLELKDRGAAPALVLLLKQPDPAVPRPADNGRTVVQEVVRVHHVTACALCHPPAGGATQPADGAAQPGEAGPWLPHPLGGPVPNNRRPRFTRYHLGHRGYTPTRLNLSSRGFLNRDVFGRHWTDPNPSLPAGGGAAGADPGPLDPGGGALANRPPGRGGPAGAAPGPGPRPAELPRFDYAIRTRAVSRKEADKLADLAAGRPSCPQHEAVLAALRGLTGQDLGSTAGAWQGLFPQPEVAVQAARLAASLTRADPLRRGVLLDNYRDGKGPAYTAALASAIPALKGPEQEKARKALAQRLTRLPAAALRDHLHDGDPEVRRAAALACARKGARALTADLKALLDDAEPAVVAAASAALQGLTGEDYGLPTSGPTEGAPRPR
jgi:HEAT repeat protein